jgi:pyruvate/2-oxoglutarate dehydrogenase complex dihydrolipoamide acyltransferase (E2) component
VRSTVKLPKVGDTAPVVVVLAWYAAVGAAVAAGEPLVQVETDKVTVDVPSPVSGTLIEQLVAPDDEVEIGAPLCVIESSD